MQCGQDFHKITRANFTKPMLLTIIQYHVTPVAEVRKGGSGALRFPTTVTFCRRRHGRRASVRHARPRSLSSTPLLCFAKEDPHGCDEATVYSDVHIWLE